MLLQRSLSRKQYGDEQGRGGKYIPSPDSDGHS